MRQEYQDNLQEAAHKVQTPLLVFRQWSTLKALCAEKLGHHLGFTVSI